MRIERDELKERLEREKSMNNMIKSLNKVDTSDGEAKVKQLEATLHEMTIKAQTERAQYESKIELQEVHIKELKSELSEKNDSSKPLIQKLNKIIDEKEETIHGLEKTLRDREAIWKKEIDE